MPAEMESMEMEADNASFWYEKRLPKPPIPDLNKTLDRYLEYAAVVAAGQKKSLHETHDAVFKFRDEGEPLQEALKEYAEKHQNWVTDFWLSEMYMRVRLPLPVNSSPAYIFPHVNFHNDEQFLRYTALLMRGICEFKDKIDRKEIAREVSTGRDKVRMCMHQYDSLLGCYREPGLEEDAQFRRDKKHMGNEHVIVMSRNQAFVLHTRIDGQMVSANDIIDQLTEVLRMSANRFHAVPIGGVGAGDRTTAARFWADASEVPENVKSLTWMKEAMFVVCLDSAIEFDYPEKSEKAMVQRGEYLLHGFGSQKYGLNRWYDATIQLVVSRSGASGLCIEHSTAEGIVIVQMAEEAIRKMRDTGRIIAPEPRGLRPKPLSWKISNRGQQLLKQQIETFDELASEMQLEVFTYLKYGKEQIKKWGVSPDGFCQLALQLAHFRFHGCLVSTYESASIRRFGGGRVDNIRANTQEALEWCTSTRDEHIGKEKRLELFRKAAAKQALVTNENITGDGIDNHLCALSVLARQQCKSLPALFTDPLWNELMRFPLSTSQVTTSPDIADCYLCYGAVVRDGYGCAYNIQSDNILFAPSAFRSNPRTDLPAFKRAIAEALDYMKGMLDVSDVITK